MQPISQRLVCPALGLVSAGLDPAGGGTGYNPLVITGPAGSGKSRLLSDWFMQQRPRLAVADAATFWDGATLGRHLAHALSAQTIDRTHERFVSCRLVVIDGVEQMTAWDSQRVLAHLFDVATAGGTAFVVSLRAHPTACRGLEPSLASRLSGGLVVSMPTVVPPRCPAAEPGPGRRASLRRIKNAAAKRHGLSAADLVGPSRCRHVAHARGLAMYLARRLTVASLQAIGTAFGGRDHTTVLHGIRVTEARRSGDPTVAAEIDEITAVILGGSPRRG